MPAAKGTRKRDAARPKLASKAGMKNAAPATADVVSDGLQKAHSQEPVEVNSSPEKQLKEQEKLKQTRRIEQARRSGRMLEVCFDEARRFCLRYPDTQETLAEKMAELTTQQKHVSRYLKRSLFATPDTDFPASPVRKLCLELQQLLLEMRRERSRRVS